MALSLALTIGDTDKENVDIVLTDTKVVDGFIWSRGWSHPHDSDYCLDIKTDLTMKKILHMDKGKKIVTEAKLIEDLFLEALFSLDIKRLEDEADGFEHTQNPQESVEADEKDPYDPKLIRVETKQFPIFQVEAMIESGDLDISPDFQREFVWTDVTRKSRLIESLLLRIPIPVFYLSQDKEGLFQVVDGIQRLTVIHSFMKNEFRLKNLEYLTECDGRWFRNESEPPEKSLPNIYTRRIEQTQLHFNVIDPQTPAEVKFDIFKRINTGGKSLNAQEIRNCLSSIKVRDMLNEMATSEAFITATRGSISTTRMADKEIVLRFIAFYLLDSGIAKRKEYLGRMDEFLDETIEILDGLNNKQIDQIKDMFIKAMKNAHLLFGERAFRKSSFINKSLFLSLTRVLYKYEPDYISKLMLNDSVRQMLDDEIENNEDYDRALSMATNDSKNVEKTYNVAKELLARCVQ